MIIREHVFGIDLEPSMMFKANIEDIADKIYKMPIAKKYFGRSPFLAPDKNMFVLQNQPGNNQFIITMRELQNALKLNMTIRHKYENTEIFNEICDFAKSCCELFKTKLDVDISRIGSIQIFPIDVEDSYSVLKNSFVKNFIDDNFDFIGGSYKFIYRTTPPSLSKTLNINVTINTVEENNKLVFEVDINNKDFGIESRYIKEIGIYSINEFVDKELFSILISKGILSHV